MSKVVCFGEIMLRLAPEGFLRFSQAEKFTAVYGGGEANVSVSLSNYGINSGFVTKLPDNPIGQAAINSLRKYGVDTSKVVRGGERVGIYYCEKGDSQRASNVVYDRANSSIAEAVPADFNWDEIFTADTELFHFTGITPALGDNATQITLEACKAAKAKGIKISCDLNFRKKLWTSEKAGKIMGELMQYVDICIANEEDAEKVFGITATGTDVTTGHLNKEGYQDVAKQLKERFNLEKVAITLRESLSASHNNWGAMLMDGDNFYYSKTYSILPIVDRVGGGDSFGGGLIYAVLQNMAPQDIIEFAVAASCLKHTIEGDFNHATLDEVKTLMAGDGSGRVQR